MINTLNTKNTLREYAKSIGSEPSDFINSIADALGQSVLLCNEDFDIVWGSHRTDDILPHRGIQEGAGYFMSEDLKKYLRDLSKSGCGVKKGIYRGAMGDWCLTLLPVSNDNIPVGYVVTIAEGIDSRLAGLLERQKKRERAYAYD